MSGVITADLIESCHISAVNGLGMEAAEVKGFLKGQLTHHPPPSSTLLHLPPSSSAHPPTPLKSQSGAGRLCRSLAGYPAAVSLSSPRSRAHRRALLSHRQPLPSPPPEPFSPGGPPPTLLPRRCRKGSDGSRKLLNPPPPADGCLRTFRCSQPPRSLRCLPALFASVFLPRFPLTLCLPISAAFCM